MLRFRFSFLMLTVWVFITSCTSPGNGGTDHGLDWVSVKDAAEVNLVLTDQWEEPRSLDINTLGWEDGINVSRNGLHLYVTYIPLDFLAFVLSDDDVFSLPEYQRGPLYSMDLNGSSIGVDTTWIHSDIIYSHRSSVSQPFSEWTLSSMARGVYSEGAVSAVFSVSENEIIDIMAFTSNENFEEDTNIKILVDVPADPQGSGSWVTPTDPVGTNQINTLYMEDNPHLERLNSSSLVLFFDSPNRPEGEGGHDIWYSISNDNGQNWSIPLNVSTVNTAEKEHQPHLYNDGTHWWLYYSAYHSDGKLAIFRRKQQITENWDSWGATELVLSAGNTAGVGEPTLTDAGDLFFVVVLENPQGTATNRSDADAWMASHL